MDALKRIRRAVRKGRYLFSEHAKEEAEADGLWLKDVVSLLLNAEIDSTYADDPRGRRYVIRGEIDDQEVDVVCRFAKNGSILILTVYVVD